jgi:hypothetical protein
MRKFLLGTVGAMVLIGAATTANAAPLVISPGTTTVVTPPDSGTFGNSFNPAMPGMFTDTYGIDLSGPSLGNGSLISVSLNAGNNIDFACMACSVMFDSTAFTLMSSGGLDVFTLNPTSLSAGLHALTITGNIVSGPSAAYSGTVNFNLPVPEPATWAMMLLGFAGIGLSMRRRQPATAALMQVA